ncbi:unnamed protein product [Allacma fusca]|uniref:Uncharacterized protein n=1 Tax=Allacma fusca TaxID=39272 RepID=A0A8J2K8C7_9HEXA|nr:unnamed protein product [Allacma fusca]
MQLRRDRYTTFDDLRRPMDFVQTYNALQILNAKAMYLNSGLVLPVNQWVYLFVASYCIYGAVKLEGLFAAVMVVSAFIMLYYLAVVFTIFAKIHSISEELLHSWRKEQQNSFIRKTLTSFKPISIWIGSYYYCDQPMVLSMFQSILEGAVDLLMLG